MVGPWATRSRTRTENGIFKASQTTTARRQEIKEFTSRVSLKEAAVGAVAGAVHQVL